MGKIIAGLVIAIALFLAGFFIAKRYSPTIKTKTVEKVVEKEVIKKDIKVVTRVIEGGKVVKEIEETDKTTVISDKKSDKKESVQIMPETPPQWKVALGTDRLWEKEQSLYSLSVERRILGPYFIGATANTKNNYTLTIGMEF